MNSIQIKSKIIFDDGIKYYYPDRAGIVSSIFSYTMEIEISAVEREFKKFSFIDFDFKYNNKYTVNNLITELMNRMNFKNGLTFDNCKSPLCILVENDLIRIDNYNYNFQKLLNKFTVQNTLTVYLLYCNQAGTIWNINGIRYYMNSKESGSHHKPHVHVELCSGEGASISIEDGEVFAGNIPTRKLKEIKKKIKENREYLFQCWNDMTDGFYHDINYHFGEIELVTE